MDVFFKKNKNKITLIFRGKIVKDNLKETPTETEAKTTEELSDDTLYHTTDTDLIGQIEKLINE